MEYRRPFEYSLIVTWGRANLSGGGLFWGSLVPLFFGGGGGGADCGGCGLGRPFIFAVYLMDHVFSARAPRLLRFILLLSFIDTLLVVSILDMI